MLDEAPGEARGRERLLVAELAAHPDSPIVLYGAGNLGRYTLSLLRAHGRDAVAFIDNSRNLWGTFVQDVPVMSPTEATARFADRGLVVVTIWRAEGGHDFLATRRDLRERGWNRVESFIPLFWGYGTDALPYITIDLPTRVLVARDAVLAAADVWSDERSLREYVNQVRWRLTADFGALSPAEPDQYFADGIVHAGGARSLSTAAPSPATRCSTWRDGLARGAPITPSSRTRPRSRPYQGPRHRCRRRWPIVSTSIARQPRIARARRTSTHPAWRAPPCPPADPRGWIAWRSTTCWPRSLPRSSRWTSKALKLPP
jgi:hypothetical protein